MAADVVDYSRLMGEDETHTLAALNALRQDILQPRIAGANGRIIKRMGDGWIVEFADVSNAVACAVDLQAGLAGHGIIRLRVGVHIGDVTIQEDDIYGDGINVAARLEALAEPGQVLISDMVHHSLDKKAAGQFGGGDMHALKNIARPVGVWRWPAGPAAADVADVVEAVEAANGLALPAKPSIAVLPFDNMSGDPEQEYFSDGITEDIITSLSKYRSFFVIARNTSFTFKGQSTDVKAAAAQLGVRYILEGSVRKSGERVRITAQLIEGESGNHIWADRFDRQLRDIFDVQDEITETIVGKIGPEIGSFERKLAARQRPGSLDAWGLMQRGLQEMWRLDAAGLAAGIDLFRQTLTQDPNLAQAHSYLSFALEQLSHTDSASDRADLLREARDHAVTAIGLDDTDALSHAVLARLYGNERRYEDAISAARHAIALNPNFSMAHHALAAICFWADRCAESIEASHQAIRLSPNDPFMPLVLAIRGQMIMRSGGDREAALENGRRAVRLQNADYRTWFLFASVCSDAGLADEARDAARRVLQLCPSFTVKRFRETWYPGISDTLMGYYVSQCALLGLPAE
ncbi:adenylate/guanylate cyclase domain-containing protein [Oceanibacterium hippocampi]|uniref:Invasion protein regulator n=1 Tax=Oceanibacterium hippocampi TaxID=745714 RepID=A0A1Y5S2P5_9PROT|nr:adenylate/guanylate cyclase domain-containing protein [Oceanibacterium hippocampi]SLN30963.1 invasion protein regulator [Oceanibacterium hippocampi]